MPRARGIRLTPWITRRGPANVELPNVSHDCYNLKSSFKGSGGFERCPVRTIEKPCKSDAEPMSRASVGRGRCVPRAPGGPVDLDRHPAGGGPRVDQFKCRVRAAGGE